MAAGLLQLQNAMSDEVVAVLMALQGNPLGFRVDKTYPPDMVKACAIQALMHGAYLVDDEWQIISGQCYLGQKYYVRRLKEYPGVTDIQIDIELPEALNDRILLVGGYARCRKGGRLVEVFARKSEQFGDSRVAVTAHKGDIDQAQGKAKKRMAQKLFERIAGVQITDAEESVQVRLIRDEPPEAAPRQITHTAEPEAVDWQAELLSHGGKDSQVFQIGVLLRDAPTQDDRDAILRAAHDHMRDGKIDFRGYDTLVRYAGSKA